MKRTSVKILCLALALVLCGAGLAFAQKAKKAAPAAEMDVNAMLLSSYDLLEKGKFDDAEKLINKVLEKDPGNPLALNNLAAVMVKKKKFDKADTYLNQALPRAKGYMVQINRVCQVGGICLAFKPVMGSAGNQELAPLVMLNIDMVKQYMAAEPLPGRGQR
ncbi:MAG: tetratricopeptide repeat protein [Desulfobaccales bacterium]